MKYPLIDVSALQRRCMASTASFSGLGSLQPASGLLTHIDKGSKVLGVAHLDYVDAGCSHFNSVKLNDHRIVFNTRLDDRLGVYLLLDYLPKLGVDCDILLTDNEEKCHSTAAEFVASKEYNWMFMFDRRGTDVVMYQYETNEYMNLLEDNKFVTGFGSYSCIAELERLGCAGFNFGCGYYTNHTSACYCDLNEAEQMSKMFSAFYRKHKDIKMPHVTDDSWGFCPVCGAMCGAEEGWKSGWCWSCGEYFLDEPVLPAEGYGPSSLDSTNSLSDSAFYNLSKDKHDKYLDDRYWSAKKGYRHPPVV